MKTEVLSMKLTEKIISILKSKATWVKASISVFVTGLFFLVISIIFSNGKNDIGTTITTTILIILALFIFPYFDKNKLCIFLIILCFYLLFLLITLFVAIYWVANVINQTQSTWLSITVAIMIIVLMYWTLHILSLATRKIKEILSKLPKASHGSKKAKILKKTFTNIGIVTSFAIAILTIIKTLLEIILIFKP